METNTDKIMDHPKLNILDDLANAIMELQTFVDMSENATLHQLWEATDQAMAVVSAHYIRNQMTLDNYRQHADNCSKWAKRKASHARKLKEQLEEERAFSAGLAKALATQQFSNTMAVKLSFATSKPASREEAEEVRSAREWFKRLV